MPSLGTQKRIARIRKRAIPEVQLAFQQGQISARRADQLLYLEPATQRAELGRLLAVQENTKRRSKIASAVIRTHLAAGRRDLTALREDLKSALASQNP
jgi:hypothetical protein